ncbi:hypothetical protein [Ammoniphilus sp. YIM 78166]|uniref:hypothetical protein n=1 Tax=Ammoniphilus sp. YIM 78166 TaxID=1644106 RepID=UPI00106FCE7F|nr:hypothetical protein [Ammoniphilus sp. YIM 78166]
MYNELPVIYQEWDEQTGQSLEPIAKVLVSQEILFLRKLVNATMIRNQIWEHTSHETDGEKSFIYVKPFDPNVVTHGEKIKQTAFSRYDLANRYEAEYWGFTGIDFQLLKIGTYEQALDAAQVLLDHYVHVHKVHYEVDYVILDPNRKKILLFLQQTSFSD